MAFLCYLTGILQAPRRKEVPPEVLSHSPRMKFCGCSALHCLSSCSLLLIPFIGVWTDMVSGAKVGSVHMATATAQHHEAQNCATLCLENMYLLHVKRYGKTPSRQYKPLVALPNEQATSFCECLCQTSFACCAGGAAAKALQPQPNLRHLETKAFGSCI